MSLSSIPISRFMTRKVLTETGDQNIQAVCATMDQRNIGSVVIVEKKDNDNNMAPVGIITERDVVHILGKLQTFLLHTPIRELMSKPLITITSEASLKDALQTMQLKNIRRLKVIEKQKPSHMVGIITDKDIFRVIMENQSLIPTLLDEQLIAEHKTIYEQFAEYWFGDAVIHKR